MLFSGYSLHIAVWRICRCLFILGLLSEKMFLLKCSFASC
ncbi:hypothetical protein HMPREF0971_00506 [Segatella oris F0302]|uniref:Uncharacterized protein n=1 Tax=Segatella oris F0302 TaxID=649760 RepID=D1QNH0_9BACT|nr:hypothetical protein HMPREF0971_00506 [Segatella oris F0302]